MNNLKQSVVACMIIILAFSLFGCSGAAPAGKSADQQTDSKSTDAKKASTDKKVELKLWSYENKDGRFKVFQEFVDEWNKKNPNIQVKFEQMPTDKYLGEKLSAALVGGNGPDVFFLSRGDYLKYVESGLVHPLDKYFTDSLKKDFLPQVLDSVTYKGKIMTYPMEMDPVVLFYDKEAFSRANLQPPKTWKDMVDAAVKLTTKDRYGIYLAPTPNAYQNFIFSPFVWQGGADFADDMLKEAKFNGKGAGQALGLWKELADKNATPKTAMTEPLANGLVAMEVAGPWKISAYQRNFPEFYEKKMGIVALPVPEGGKQITVYGGWGLALNSRSKNIDEAAKFLMWLFSEPDRAVRWNVEARTSISPQQSIRDSEKHKKFWSEDKHKIFLDVFKQSQAESAMPPEVNKIIQDAIQSAVNNQGTSEELAKKANAQIENYIKSRK